MALTDYVIMPSADYQATCDAIREKTGKTDILKSGELASLISAISGGGGGGGAATSGWVMTTGSITPGDYENADETAVIEHNLGVVPDIFIIGCGLGNQTPRITYGIGFSKDVFNALGKTVNVDNICVHYLLSGTSYEIHGSNSIDSTNATANDAGLLRNATATTIQVGGGTSQLTALRGKIDVTGTYSWVAIGNIFGSETQEASE